MISRGNEAQQGTLMGAFCIEERVKNMTILICIIVSAITSVAVVKLFAYRYFDVIDDYVKGTISDAKAILRQTTRDE